MADVFTGQLVCEVRIDDVQQVIDLAVGDLHPGRVTVILLIGGADQAELPEIGNDEDDAPILVLQDIGMVPIVELRHHDMAALNQAHAVRGALAKLFIEEGRHPGAGGVHQGARPDGKAAAVVAFQVQVPQPLAAARADATGAGVDMRALLTGSHGVQHHQAGIVDPAVGVFEAVADLVLQWAVGAEAHAMRSA